MKREINIWSHDLQFLVKHFPEPALQAAFGEARGQMPAANSGNTLVLSLDDDQTELLMDALSMLLTTKGVDSDGKLNALGGQIERLIDIISPG